MSSPGQAGSTEPIDEGCGRAWAKEDHQGLARYVYPQEASRSVRLGSSPIDVLDAPGGRLTLIQRLYEELAGAGIGYAHELWNPDDRCQTVRPPVELTSRPGHGTCLDLSLFFCGLCLSVDLLPVVVVTQRHALVLVSLDVGPDGYNARTRPRRTLFTDGPVTDAAALAALIDHGHYVAVETTGFAAVSSLPASSLEGAGRVDGLLGFEQAVAAGRKRFDLDDDPLRFALDIAATHGLGIGPQRIFADTETLVDEVLLKATEHGLRADRTEGAAAELRQLPPPGAPPPRHSRGVIGRHREKSALAAVSAGELVGVYGELGTGKTELMRWLAYEPSDDLADGTVYLRCQDTGPLDVLQEVFEFFYDPRSGIQVTPSSAARYLGDKRARILLDDFDLSPTATEALQDAMAESGLVVAATGPEALAVGSLVEMGPFAPNEALDLFEREAGSLAKSDRSDLLVAFERTETLPRSVVVFARAVRAATLSIADVVDGLAELPARTPAQSAREKWLAEVIKAASPAYVPRSRLLEMIDAPQAELDADLAKLIDDELIKSGSPRYRWTGPGGPATTFVANELVTATREWLESGPVPDEVIEDRALVLRAIELAEGQSHWRDVSHLARLSEGSLALGNRWDAWERVLRSMGGAAEHLGDERALAWADHQLGTRALALGDHGTARARLGSAVERRERLGDRAAAELSRHNLDLLPPAGGGDGGEGDRGPGPDGGNRLGWLRAHPFIAGIVGLVVAVGIALIVWAAASGGSDPDPAAADNGAVTPEPDDRDGDDTRPVTPEPDDGGGDDVGPPVAMCGDSEVEGPDGQCESEVAFVCGVTTPGPIVAGQPAGVFSDHAPDDVAVEITFDFGDGTRKQADKEGGQDATYTEPGEYTISARWTTELQSGVVECGTVEVTGPPGCADGEIEGPNGLCEPEVSFECGVSTDGPIRPGESVEVFAVSTPADVGIDITFDYGNGTREQADESNAQQVFYFEPGTYEITAGWRTRAQSGFGRCGTVEVEPPVVTPQPCIGFDGLDLGLGLGVGEAFTEGAAEMIIGEFYIGGDAFDGFAQVIDDGLAGGSGNELFLNNVNLVLILPEAEGWTVQFGEFGGSVNLAVNEDNLGAEASTLAEWDGASFGGANIFVENGRLIVQGPGVEVLAIGGQEFAIDEICPFGPPA